MDERASYKSAGVDIDKANLFVEKIKPLVKTTTRKEVLSGIGGFGALFRLDTENSRIRSWFLRRMAWGQS